MSTELRKIDPMKVDSPYWLIIDGKHDGLVDVWEAEAMQEAVKVGQEHAKRFGWGKNPPLAFGAPTRAEKHEQDCKDYAPEEAF